MPFAIAHLMIAAVWLGSMVYSLAVVQPKDHSLIKGKLYGLPPDLRLLFP
jgi:putative copper export protein